MCTAVTYYKKDHYFGRNLDLEFSYRETVTITPRNFLFSFRSGKEIKKHYALIGMAYVVDNYPLYYDAMNEKGLCMAGLNFPGNAYYKKEEMNNRDNIAPFEFIPWILGQCATVKEAKGLLERINLIHIDFSQELPVSPLHWMIADRTESITVEAVKEGIQVYDNPVGVLTNNPPFPYQMFQLNNYMSLSKEQPENAFSKELHLCKYSRGMGAIGLPGDLSSMSRFVRASFTKMNSVSAETENESVSQVFHILGSVEQQRGCVHMGKDLYEITIYSSCCNMEKGIYYYRTYENSQIAAVCMHHEDLDGEELALYSLMKEQQIKMQN